MQKLRERTTEVKGRISIIEDDWAPMQRESHAQQLLVAKHAARLDDLENRLRRNNMRAIGWKNLGKILFLLFLQWSVHTESPPGLYLWVTHLELFC